MYAGLIIKIKNEDWDEFVRIYKDKLKWEDGRKLDENDFSKIKQKRNIYIRVLIAKDEIAIIGKADVYEFNPNPLERISI